MKSTIRRTLHSMGTEFDLTHCTSRELNLNQFDMDLEDKNKIYWFHCDLKQPEMLKTLKEKLNLSPELLKLCQKEARVPLVKDTSDTLTIRIQCPSSDHLNSEQEITFQNLIIHLTPKYCLTASFQTPLPLKMFQETYAKSLKYAKTPCFILFLILDNTVNDYASMLFNLEEVVEEADVSIRTSHAALYKEMMNTKKQIMKTKRYAASICDILMRISARKIFVISEDCRISLLELFNHSKMLLQEADAIRDIVNGTLDQINNALMHRMNETMRILTAFAAIFMPLSLISGIYGMNFHWMPELTWKYGYFWALFLMIFCALGLLSWFKKMRWF
jgi:magnesium transporter